MIANEVVNMDTAHSPVTFISNLSGTLAYFSVLLFAVSPGRNTGVRSPDCTGTDPGCLLVGVVGQPRILNA